MTPGFRGRIRRLLAAGLVAIALAAPSAVSADTTGPMGPAYSNGATATVVSVSFDSKLVATVTLAMTCEPFDHDWSGSPLDPWPEGTLYGWVELMQAQGRSIAHASGTLHPTGGAMTEPDELVVCDGSLLLVQVEVVSSDMPLRRGDVVVGADIGMNATACCSYEGNSASTGPIKVRMR